MFFIVAEYKMKTCYCAELDLSSTAGIGTSDMIGQHRFFVRTLLMFVLTFLN
jgi:hypothetical protein